jgi:hypothetical protein
MIRYQAVLVGPTPTALEGALREAAVADHARKHGLPAACRLLFNLNEFVFVD